MCSCPHSEFLCWWARVRVSHRSPAKIHSELFCCSNIQPQVVYAAPVHQRWNVPSVCNFMVSGTQTQIWTIEQLKNVKYSHDFSECKSGESTQPCGAPLPMVKGFDIYPFIYLLYKLIASLLTYFQGERITTSWCVHSWRFPIAHYVSVCHFLCFTSTLSV